MGPDCEDDDPIVVSIRDLPPAPSPPEKETMGLTADLLIDAFGGIEIARNVAGGVRWWQVRGLEGIPAEWIMVRKDIDARRRRRKAEKEELRRSKSARNIRTIQKTAGPAVNNATHRDDDNEPEPHVYSSEMDGTPCMLYIHGGGGYFGSIDQERYMLHRYARKMSGRVFDLYLIKPPPGAPHAPVDPASIIIAGDSSGGNLCLALLQVIRDVGLPPASGAILISPWCDLTHSFASCFDNMPSDVMPMYGLNKHKPSTLWPPPAPMDTAILRDKISTRLQRVIGIANGTVDGDTDTITLLDSEKKGTVMNQRETAWGDKVTLDKIPGGSATISGNKSMTAVSMHPGDGNNTQMKTTVVPAPVEIKTTARCDDGATLLVDGKAVTINSQIQFYATNRQANHPYVSPILGYLGGLPPCLFIVSDKECLRDEIVYTAHKAAHPETYLLKEETREFHPPIVDIEKRYGPTDVHLQIYDETCHVLPMYSFTTPAKYCFRAIASFCKFVTKTGETSRQTTVVPSHQSSTKFEESDANTTSNKASSGSKRRSSLLRSLSFENSPLRRPGSTGFNHNSLLRRLSLSPAAERGVASGNVTPPSVAAHRASAVMASIVTEEPEIITPRGHSTDRRGETLPDGIETAGNPMVYACDEGGTPFMDHMIRERVSTQGVVRALEPASEIYACNIPLDEICVLNERSVRRYINGQVAWGKKFSGVTKSIEKSREKNLKLAKKEGVKTLDYLRIQLHKNNTRRSRERDEAARVTPPGSGSAVDGASAGEDAADEHDAVSVSEVNANNVLGSRHWTWGWVLDGENPPPSSIASRRDTEEARRLSKVADRQIGEGDAEHNISGNHLWSMVVEALAAHAMKNRDKAKAHDHPRPAEPSTPPSTPSHRKSLSRFLPFMHPKEQS
ncbi:hypothetical protein FRB98_005539 [Tulasnella sp. 332]|nr:hypothetical protein FRB98_005539 [Tulasnella sp. 332]